MTRQSSVYRLRSAFNAQVEKCRLRSSFDSGLGSFEFESVWFDRWWLADRLYLVVRGPFGRSVGRSPSHQRRIVSIMQRFAVKWINTNNACSWLWFNLSVFWIALTSVENIGKSTYRLSNQIYFYLSIFHYMLPLSMFRTISCMVRNCNNCYQIPVCSYISLSDQVMYVVVRANIVFESVAWHARSACYACLLNQNDSVGFP